MDETNSKIQIRQFPHPGSASVMFCGDTLLLTLTLSSPIKGRAWVRTNLGASRIIRKEIIDQVEKDRIPLGKSWFDHKMIPDGDRTYFIRLPLHETGFFQAKCFFIPDGKTTPIWPEGENVTLNVQPPGSCCANIIYNAFVRQFKHTRDPKPEKKGHTGTAPPHAATSDPAMVQNSNNDGMVNGHGCHSVTPENGNNISISTVNTHGQNSPTPDHENDKGIFTVNYHTNHIRAFREMDESIIHGLDQKGYTVIPESGKFRDLMDQVDFIFSELGCRVLHLLPIHPTPTTYARMGRFGSPYAALNFTDVDPALAVFDPKATPLEQFMELVDRVHCHGGYLFMDIAINHTGWAATIHETHPEWLVRDDEGKIEAPGAWGVVWEDLTKLDYSRKDLWTYMASIFLLWCHRGVDGFRCDAGYMIPVPAWEYMVAKVRDVFPDTLFFLEGLGGPLETTGEILTRANFNWAYSELFQTYTKDALTHYLPQAWDISHRLGHLIHFAETHDNNRLAAISPTHAKMRTALSALFSVCGGFGFANGVEWFATKKIDVHDAPSLNWGSEANQVEHIARINHILKTHPSFFAAARLSLVDCDNPNVLVLCRHNPEAKKHLYILVNLDCEAHQEIAWSHPPFHHPMTWYDLISKNEMTATIQEGIERVQSRVILRPGEVLAATPHEEDLDLVSPDRTRKRLAPDQVTLQKYKAMLLKVLTHIRGFGHLKPIHQKESSPFNETADSVTPTDDLKTSTDDPDNSAINLKSSTDDSETSMDLTKEALAFADNPMETIRNIIPDTEEPRVIPYEVPRDIKRQVMIPPGFFLLIRARVRFRAYMLDTAEPQCGHGVSPEAFSSTEDSRPRSRKTLHPHSSRCLVYEEGIPTPSGDHFFTLIPPMVSGKKHLELYLHLRIFESSNTRVDTGKLLLLAPMEKLSMAAVFTRQKMSRSPHLKLLSTTKSGAMMRAAADFGKLESRYDGLLCANLSPHYPENRRMIWARCRAWSIFQGYSRSLSTDALASFRFSYTHGGMWRFFVPTSEGSSYVLDLSLMMDRNDNRVTLSVKRRSAYKRDTALLRDEVPVTLILRPDVENRDFHETVKAYTGPEHRWPQAITPHEKGFTFDLSEQLHNENGDPGECQDGGENGSSGVSEACSTKKWLALFTINQGQFFQEPEWHYMVHRPLEATRGLDAASDLFSPGYFTVSLNGGETVRLTAAVIASNKRPWPDAIPATSKHENSEGYFHGEHPWPDPMPAPPKHENGEGYFHDKSPFEGSRLIDPIPLPDPLHFQKKMGLPEALYQSLDAFIVNRDGGRSVIAGFPWFLDWGRDSLIFCRSLIELGRLDEALAILKTFGRFEDRGTLPNMISGEDARNIETSDAPLWFFACCRDLVEMTQDFGILNVKTSFPQQEKREEQKTSKRDEEHGREEAHRDHEERDKGGKPKEQRKSLRDEEHGREEAHRDHEERDKGGKPEEQSRTLKEILISMGTALMEGTATGVKCDPETKLIYSPSHFTWMDTNHPAGTPRQGYPIEIQALWYNALMLLSDIDPEGRWKETAKTVKDAIMAHFWQEDLGYFSDCLHIEGHHPVTDPPGAKTAEPDDALRPNQLLLITLGVITEKTPGRKTVERCLELLVPGAIRSLADRPLSRPLYIERDGKPLSDPHAPYCGTYQGDEDTLRKPAYHNGTAWTWQFPLFCEAWAAVFGKQAYPTALAWLGSVIRLMDTGAAGFIPEILDGDTPHTPRGCDAQAWGCSESARVIHKLNRHGRTSATPDHENDTGISTANAHGPIPNRPPQT